MNIQHIPRKASWFIRQLKALPAELRLQVMSYQERQRYRVLSNYFSAHAASLNAYDSRPFITPLWNAFNSELEKALLPAPPWNFLRQKTISQTMVMTKAGKLLRVQLAALENTYGIAGLRKLATESAFGAPRLDIPGLACSHNTIHHLYHIHRWSQATSQDPSRIRSVLEWGGGYGNFARLLLQRSPRATYTIVDTPLLCCLQWLYLSVTMPNIPVHLISSPAETVQSGAINIIPVGLVERLKPTADLFVSTWAISESSREAQDLAARYQWFGARHLLIGFQESNPALPDAGHIQALAQGAGAQVEDFPVLKHQHYAFR